MNANTLFSEEIMDSMIVEPVKFIGPLMDNSYKKLPKAEKKLQKGLIIFVNSLFSWMTKGALSRDSNYNPNVSGYLGSSVEMAKEFVQELQKEDYKVILTYCSARYEKETTLIAQTLKADGVAQNPEYSKRGDFASVAHQFGIPPYKALFIVAGKKMVDRIRNQGLSAGFVKSDDPINSMLAENNTYQSQNMLSSTLRSTKYYLCNKDSELLKNKKLAHYEMGGD